MRPFNEQDIVSTPSKPTKSNVSGQALTSARRLAASAVATLALTGAEVANADIVTLPVGVNSISLSGQFFGPTSIGGVGTYTLFTQDDVEFTGEAILGTPVEGGVYTLTLNAMRETGEKFDMIMSFGDLRFITDQSFEAFGSPSSPRSNQLQGVNILAQNTPSVYANWDYDGIGLAEVSYGNAHINAVPEPSSIALMAAGLGAVGLAARRRRSPTGAAPATGTTQKPETSEEASV